MTPPRGYRVPSLLRSLLHDHLDPGYAAAARKRARAAGPPSPRAMLAAKVWLVIGTLLAGLALGLTRGWAEERAPDADQLRASLQSEIRSAQARAAELGARRDVLAEEGASARARALLLDEPGRAALAELRRAELAAGTVPATGPGLLITVSEPPGQRDLSGGYRGAGARNTILDRDLQIVVNALWSAGAEAISVGGVRIGPNVAIRQAGSAILVDNRVAAEAAGAAGGAVSYVIAAVGDPRAMQSSFIASSAYIRMSGISQLYGAGFTVREETSITVPAAPVRDIRVAAHRASDDAGTREGEP